MNELTAKAQVPEGSTPLTGDELNDLIPHWLTTRAELNQWEAMNIADAYVWTSGQRTPRVLSVPWLQDLHRAMFDQTWRWAGQFRRSDNNISPYPWYTVPSLIQNCVEDVSYQYASSAKSSEKLDDIAVRFHHRLVAIHPWPNGNGRHARLATDTLLQLWEQPIFTWGNSLDIETAESAREKYIQALRSADRGDISPLREFVRS